MKKRCVALFICIVMLFAGSLSLCGFAEEENIAVVVDGQTVEFDVLPQLINGRTMVPIRAIFETMGAAVEWDESTSSAICTKGDTTVIMTIGSVYMYVNGEARVMDVTPSVLNGRTLAPARYVAEAFGATVEWDEVSNTVVIQSKVTMYALDGRTILISKSAVEDYIGVGWYETIEETQQTLYAADGRTITIYRAFVPEYKQVGWYETWEEAEAANKKANESSAQYNPTADGYYYRTPTGKRYHLDPNCGGKNSYRTTNIRGLTPCKKCAR